MEALGRFLTHRATVALCQTAVAILFVVVAVRGIADPAAFARAVHGFRVTPPWLENPIAITVPWIALTLAVAILLRGRPRAGAAVALGLLLFLTVAVAAAVARGLDPACGCPASEPAARLTLLRLGQSVGMMVLALLGSLRPRL